MDSTLQLPGGGKERTGEQGRAGQGRARHTSEQIVSCHAYTTTHLLTYNIPFDSYVHRIAPHITSHRIALHHISLPANFYLRGYKGKGASLQTLSEGLTIFYVSLFHRRVTSTRHKTETRNLRDVLLQCET